VDAQVSFLVVVVVIVAPRFHKFHKSNGTAPFKACLRTTKSCTDVVFSRCTSALQPNAVSYRRRRRRHRR
jgi:hypothetical protein